LDALPTVCESRRIERSKIETEAAGVPTSGTNDVNLTLPDVIRLFNVTENTIRNWVSEDNLPCEIVDDRYRFNRAELLEWATIRKLDVSPSIFALANGEPAPKGSLSAALERGGISYGVKAPHKRALLRAIVDSLTLPKEFDRDVLWDLFLAREALGSTALERGIAVPHPRRPVVLDVERPLVHLCFLSEPLDFQASDGTWVDTLFAMIAPTVHEHLRLLARLASVLNDQRVRDTLSDRAAPKDIFAAVAEAERQLDGRPAGAA
jgi:PTS system nitrogen regulatory IIA component